MLAETEVSFPTQACISKSVYVLHLNNCRLWCLDLFSNEIWNMMF